MTQHGGPAPTSGRESDLRRVELLRPAPEFGQERVRLAEHRVGDMDLVLPDPAIIGDSAPDALDPLLPVALLDVAGRVGQPPGDRVVPIRRGRARVHVQSDARDSGGLHRCQTDSPGRAKQFRLDRSVGRLTIDITRGVQDPSVVFVRDLGGWGVEHLVHELEMDGVEIVLRHMRIGISKAHSTPLTMSGTG